MSWKKILALACLAVTSFALGQISAGGSHHLHATTLENLSTAMHGEAFAHAKYTVFAEHAREEGNPELAKLFETTANTEKYEHFAEEAKLAGIVGSDIENLKDAIAGESYESQTMYPDFAAAADRVGDHEAALRFREIAADEARHLDAFRVELAHLEAQSHSGQP
ncbi:MAG: rubrerythrin family protein [Acidobacteria bacterium]|jgi:rubrerythrin|nr:rubrerythrin family protein [Acidobacteriota bacterium]